MTAEKYQQMTGVSRDLAVRMAELQDQCTDKAQRDVHGGGGGGGGLTACFGACVIVWLAGWLLGAFGD